MKASKRIDREIAFSTRVTVPGLRPRYQESPVPRYSESTLAAIKNAVDIVGLVGESLQLHRVGSKFKTLCPFHDDHKPSLELNPERQSYKCWSCGAGGDVFDFVMEYERLEFPEALRMLAERAGITLEASNTVASEPKGPSKTELLAVCSWAEHEFRQGLMHSEPALDYLQRRLITSDSVERFQIGYAPGERGWLVSKGKRAGFPLNLLEKAGLVTIPDDAPGMPRERFRGRLMFPIRDLKGRAIGFGGRILPEAERHLAAVGKTAPKYLNSPETPLFQKRKLLYAADLARTAAREAGWIAVVEGYTDVILAHQVGLRNVVGTLGTALGDDHVLMLRRLADRIILVFDGDNAGQNAADRSLELFLGHQVDVRVLTLPEDLDPADFLLKEGAAAFRSLVEQAVDPLAFALLRAESRFDLSSLEGSRLAADWVLGILAKIPSANRQGMDVKVDKAVDTLATRLRVPVTTLRNRLSQIRRGERSAEATRNARKFSALAVGSASTGPSSPIAERGSEGGMHGDRGVNLGQDSPRGNADEPAPPIRIQDLDPLDRELTQILLNDPGVVGQVITRVSLGSVVDAPIRAILQAIFDLHGEGETADFSRVVLRLSDPRVRALAAGLLLPLDPAPLPAAAKPAPWDERLTRVLAMLSERDRLYRLRDVEEALKETDSSADPDTHRALRVELFRLMIQRPGSRN